MSAVAGETPSFRAKKLIFWDFPRASWQYDIVVAFILLFIFATPRSWFNDQPRGSNVVLMSSEHGQSRFFIASETLISLNAAARVSRAESLIRGRTGKRWRVSRLEPIKDEADHEVRGFIAYTRP